jgi:hypothetical protein
MPRTDEGYLDLEVMLASAQGVETRNQVLIRLIAVAYATKPRGPESGRAVICALAEMLCETLRTGIDAKEVTPEFAAMVQCAINKAVGTRPS